MAWYNPKDWFGDNTEKLNPAQHVIARQEGSFIGSDYTVSYTTAFESLESVNRGVNMIVSACSSLDFDVKSTTAEGVIKGMRQKTLVGLLNHTPNPFQRSPRISLQYLHRLCFRG